MRSQHFQPGTEETREPRLLHLRPAFWLFNGLQKDEDFLRRTSLKQPGLLVNRVRNPVLPEGRGKRIRLLAFAAQHSDVSCTQETMFRFFLVKPSRRIMEQPADFLCAQLPQLTFGKSSFFVQRPFQHGLHGLRVLGVWQVCLHLLDKCGLTKKRAVPQ